MDGMQLAATFLLPDKLAMVAAPLNYETEETLLSQVVFARCFITATGKETNSGT